MVGRRAAISTRARISLTAMVSPSGTIAAHVGVGAARVVWQPGSRRSRRRRALQGGGEARAATERPEPGGPVNSQACVMAPGRMAGVVSRITAGRVRGSHQLGFDGVLTHKTRENTAHQATTLVVAGRHVDTEDVGDSARADAPL